MFEDFKFVDLHQHGLLSGDVESLNKQGLRIEKISISTIGELTNFTKKNINPYLDDKSCIKKFLVSNFEEAIKSNTILICPSIDYTLCKKFESIDKFASFLSDLKQEYNSKLKIFFDLGISRNNYVSNDFEMVKNLLESNVFFGLDLYGDETISLNNDIEKIYRIAKKLQIRKKAHVGEYGSAKDVFELFKNLELDEIQHGIAIAQDEQILEYFSKQNVIFNICLSSNKCLLNLNYEDNVTRLFFDKKIKFSINTDDKLYFHKSIKDEYEELLNLNIFNQKELNQINKSILSYAKKYYLK